MWIDCSIQTQKLEAIPIFFPIAGFFLKMAANNQSCWTGVGKFTYRQQIGDSLVRGDTTHLILLEFNFSLPALCLQADLSLERKMHRKQEKEFAILSKYYLLPMLLGIRDVPQQKLRSTLFSRSFAVVTSGQGCCYSALHCRPSQTWNSYIWTLCQWTGMRPCMRKTNIPMAGKNRLKQQPQSNPRGKYVSCDSQSLMKRPVSGILDPGLSTASLERCTNKGIAEAKYQRLVVRALKDWKLGINQGTLQVRRQQCK